MDDEVKEEEKTEETTEETKKELPDETAGAETETEPLVDDPDALAVEEQLDEECAIIRDEVLDMTDEIKNLEDQVDHIETLKEAYPDNDELERMQNETENKIEEIKQAARDRIGDLKRCDISKSD